MKYLLAMIFVFAVATPALAYQNCTQICNDTREGGQQCHFEGHQD